jgi:hypothetical protein
MCEEKYEKWRRRGSVAIISGHGNGETRKYRRRHQYRERKYLKKNKPKAGISKIRKEMKGIGNMNEGSMKMKTWRKRRKAKM